MVIHYCTIITTSNSDSLQTLYKNGNADRHRTYINPIIHSRIRSAGDYSVINWGVERNFHSHMPASQASSLDIMIPTPLNYTLYFIVPQSITGLSLVS